MKTIRLSALFLLFLVAVPLRATEDPEDCLWGGAGERTSYQVPYCPGMAPAIPVLPKKDDSATGPTLKAVSPETALTVRTSDGQCYSYYYREETQMQLRTDLPPDQQFMTVSREQINPCTGQWENYPVQVPTPGHYWYEPVRVRVKVVTPCPPPCEEMNQRFGTPPEPPGAASVGFSSQATD